MGRLTSHGCDRSTLHGVTWCLAHESGWHHDEVCDHLLAESYQEFCRVLEATAADWEANPALYYSGRYLTIILAKQYRYL